MLTRWWDLRWALSMPGRRHVGPLPELTAAQATLAAELRGDVTHLSEVIGHRHAGVPGAYGAAADWLESQLAATGLGPVRRQTFITPGPSGPVPTHNIYIDVHPAGDVGAEGCEAEGASAMLVYAAHYDSVPGSPAGNDNGSGVAAVLALARHLSRHVSRHSALHSVQACAEQGRPATPPVRLSRPIRLALLANEEPPWFWTRHMGSLVLAREMKRQGLRVAAMLTPETIGCYSDEPGSQHWPPPLGPLLRRAHGDRGDFIAFVGLGGTSAALVRQCVGAFRSAAAFPAIGASLPNIIPGAGSSDHWSFWQQGWPALMITDTAPFRYRWYHTTGDLAKHMDFDRMARVVEGLNRIVPGL
jgi:hypothetical protein